MNRFILTLLVVSLLSLSLSISSASPQKNKSKNSSALPVLIKSQKNWTPIVFLDNDFLPPKYNGNNYKFFENFKNKLEKMNKGEFETSEEFALRTENQEALLSPISSSNYYAFRINDFLQVKYDSDRSLYKIDHKNSCKDAPLNKTEFVTCWIVDGYIKSEIDTYIVTNAYGATTDVERSRGLQFSLALSLQNKMFISKLVKDDYFDRYNYHDNVMVSLDKARKLKNKSIAMLLVGRIKEAKIIKGIGYYVKPTIDWPSDRAIDEEALPFELKKIIYYVYETGEILQQQDI